jgi:multidrug resistance efflux pump
MDGQILEVSTYPGEAIGAGGLLAMGETGDMMVDAEVDVLDLARVRKGGPVRITGEGLAREATGKVEEIFLQVTANALLDPAPLANADLRVVRVRIRPDRPGALEGLVNAVVSVRFLP